MYKQYVSWTFITLLHQNVLVHNMDIHSLVLTKISFGNCHDCILTNTPLRFNNKGAICQANTNYLYTKNTIFLETMTDISIIDMSGIIASSKNQFWKVTIAPFPRQRERIGTVGLKAKWLKKLFSANGDLNFLNVIADIFWINSDKMRLLRTRTWVSHQTIQNSFHAQEP